MGVVLASAHQVVRLYLTLKIYERLWLKKHLKTYFQISSALIPPFKILTSLQQILQINCTTPTLPGYPLSNSNHLFLNFPTSSNCTIQTHYPRLFYNIEPYKRGLTQDRYPGPYKLCYYCLIKISVCVCVSICLMVKGANVHLPIQTSVTSIWQKQKTDNTLPCFRFNPEPLDLRIASQYQFC